MAHAGMSWMWISYALNGHGTPVSVHICNDCGSQFTVCPAVDKDGSEWGGCLATICISYDRKRDADRMFDEGRVKRR